MKVKDDEGKGGERKGKDKLQNLSVNCVYKPQIAWQDVFCRKNFKEKTLKLFLKPQSSKDRGKSKYFHTSKKPLFSSGQLF